MWSGVPFAQVLADKLGRSSQDGPAAGGRAWYGSKPNPVVLLFDTGPCPSAIDAGKVAGAYGIPHRPHPVDRSSPPPIRPAGPVLTAAQRVAFNQLVKLGAQLDTNFSEHELRRAFRTLARAYHPDSHPGCSDFEKARLSRQFAALHAAYLLLRPTPRTPPSTAA